MAICTRGASRQFPRASFWGQKPQSSRRVPIGFKTGLKPVFRHPCGDRRESYIINPRAAARTFIVAEPCISSRPSREGKEFPALERAGGLAYMRVRPTKAYFLNHRQWPPPGLCGAGRRYLSLCRGSERVWMMSPSVAGCGSCWFPHTLGRERKSPPPDSTRSNLFVSCLSRVGRDLGNPTRRFRDGERRFGACSAVSKPPPTRRPLL